LLGSDCAYITVSGFRSNKTDATWLLSVA